MSLTADRVLKLARILKVFDPHPDLALEGYLRDIPKLDSLADVPSGTSVLVRGDVDAKPGAEVGQGDIRLRSMQGTLQFGRERGWKQIVFGHLGRKQPDKPIGSLAKVAARLGKILDCDVPLVTDWFDEAALTVKPHVAEAIAASPPGSVLVLENVRGYDLETVLWKA
jgi:phosphoglycerate kinase